MFQQSLLFTQEVFFTFQCDLAFSYHVIVLYSSVVELDEQSVKAFIDEDDFIISLDYDSIDGTCNITLSCSSSS
jgi:hypothetical protein